MSVFKSDPFMIPSPTDLTYFMEICHSLNLSHAAKRIGVTQPSLTLAMQRLESALGTALFVRCKQGLVLTRAGKRFHSQVKELLLLWDEIKQASLSLHTEVQGSVTLGIHPSVALYTLANFLPRLLQDYPKLEIQFKHDLSRRVLEDIINLKFDMGIIVNPVKHPDLIIHKIYDDQVTFWYTKEKSSLQDLQSGDAVLIYDDNLIQAQTLLKRISRQKIKFKRMLTSSNLEVIANLTANGAGIGIIPSRVAQAAYPDKLIPVPKMPHYHDEICLVYRHENRHIKVIQAIVTYIKKCLIKR